MSHQLRKPRTWADRIALAAAVVLVTIGLTAVAWFVALAYGLSQWAENK